jgi:Fe-S-cluster containining protein
MSPLPALPPSASPSSSPSSSPPSSSSSSAAPTTAQPAWVRFVRRRLAQAYIADVERRRARLRARGQLPWELRGDCGGCARCCEEPGIAVDVVVFFVPFVRRAFLWWQRVVNGFDFRRAERAGRVLYFSCRHFDATTRRCRDYEHRPGLCRDYPRLQLEVFEPELFDSCGYRVVARNGEAMIAALRANGVAGEQLVQITRRLRLE